MRFCMVSDYYPPFHAGGSGIHVYELANELARRGHDVDVVHSVDAFFAKHKSPRSGHWRNHAAVQVWPLRSRAGILAPLTTMVTGRPLLYRRKLKALLAGDFDVIHHHAQYQLGGPQSFRYGRALRLATLHTYWLLCPTSWLYRNCKTNCVKRTCLSCTMLHYH